MRLFAAKPNHQADGSALFLYRAISGHNPALQPENAFSLPAGMTLLYLG